MKKIKLFISLLLTMVMIITMIVPATAVSNGNIITGMRHHCVVIISPVRCLKLDLWIQLMSVISFQHIQLPMVLDLLLAIPNISGMQRLNFSKI